MSLELLQAGFHVLCEKPLARKAEEVDRLIAAAKQAGKVLAVFQQARFNPVFLQLRKVIDSGLLGRIVQISLTASNFSRRWDWQTLKAYNGGNLLNTGAHYLDQMLQLIEAETTPNVVCHMDNANSFGDAEDYCKIILTGDGKPLVDIEISSCNVYPGPTYTIQGTNGGLKASLNAVEWKYFKPEEAPAHELETKPIRNVDGLPAYCKEELQWYEESWQLDAETANPSPHIAFYRSLHATMTEGMPLVVSPEQVRLQIAVMERCFRQNPLFAPEA